MSNLSFKPYQDAYDAYLKDLEQLTGIGDRLVASATGVRDERTRDVEKLETLKTLGAQIDKLPQAFKDAQNRYDAASTRRIRPSSRSSGPFAPTQKALAKEMPALATFSRNVGLTTALRVISRFAAH
jgi:hypothetical protein